MDIKYYANYCPSADISYIMLEVIQDGETKSVSCIGWYYGEPDENNNCLFRGKLTATFK